MIADQRIEEIRNFIQNLVVDGIIEEKHSPTIMRAMSSIYDAGRRDVVLDGPEEEEDEEEEDEEEIILKHYHPLTGWIYRAFGSVK